MKKLSSLVGLLYQGAALANRSTWANRTALASALTGLTSAVVLAAGAYGLPLPVDESTAETIGLGLAALVSTVTAVLIPATNPDAGLPAPDAPPPPSFPDQSNG